MFFVQDIPCLMVPVHLADIRPAGGPHWSTTALDELKDTVIEHFNMFYVKVNNKLMVHQFSH